MSTAQPSRLPDPVTEPIITAARVAQILKLSVRMVYVSAEEGTIPCIRVGRSVRIPTRRFLAAFFPEALPTEFDLTSDSVALTRENTPGSHANLTGAASARRTGLTAVPDSTEAA